MFTNEWYFDCLICEFQCQWKQQPWLLWANANWHAACSVLVAAAVGDILNTALNVKWICLWIRLLLSSQLLMSSLPSLPSNQKCPSFDRHLAEVHFNVDLQLASPSRYSGVYGTADRIRRYPVCWSTIGIKCALSGIRKCRFTTMRELD